MPLRTSKGSKAPKRKSVSGQSKRLNVRSSNRTETKKAEYNDTMQKPFSPSDQKADNAAALARFQANMPPVGNHVKGGKYTPQLLNNPDFYYAYGDPRNEWVVPSPWVMQGIGGALGGLVWTFTATSLQVRQSVEVKEGEWYEVRFVGRCISGSGIEVRMHDKVLYTIPVNGGEYERVTVNWLSNVTGPVDITFAPVGVSGGSFIYCYCKEL